jgi:ABC-type transport system involved in multi-copper enzyme maturation permease subunit
MSRLPAPRLSAALPARWRAVRVVQARDLRALLLAPGIYVALALGMLAALLEVRNYLDAVARSRLLILADALTLPFFFAALVVMLFLALTSAATIAREKDQGTLEVLFYGPVDHWTYVLAKHLAQVLGYLAAGLALAVLLAGYAVLSGLRLAGAFPLALLLSVGVAAAVAAAGICCSTLTRSARAAIALLLAVVALLLAVRVGSGLLSGIELTNNASPLLFLRDFTIALDRALTAVSPVGVFEQGIDAAVRGDLPGYAGALLLTGVQTVVLLVSAVVALRRRGVRR